MPSQRKQSKASAGLVQIDVPRDRESSFEPQLIKKGQTRKDFFDDKIISMYARGMTCREIKAHLQEIYSVEVSPDMISIGTDAVTKTAKRWPLI